MATELVMLVVDRFVAELSASNDAQKKRSLANFRGIFEDIDRKRLLIGVLAENPDTLSTDGRPFFDADRHKTIEEATGRGETHPVDLNPTTGGDCEIVKGPTQEDDPRINMRSGMRALDPLSMPTYNRAAFRLRRVTS